MKLLIHVGLHKTGTTSFQNSLWTNKQKLIEQNVLYPHAGICGSQHALIPGTLFDQHPFLPAERSLNISHYINLLNDEIDSYSPNLMILSSEVFTEALSKDQIRTTSLFKAFEELSDDICILVTTRNEYSYAISTFKHVIRSNFLTALKNPASVLLNQINRIRL